MCVCVRVCVCVCMCNYKCFAGMFWNVLFYDPMFNAFVTSAYQAYLKLHVDLVIATVVWKFQFSCYYVIQDQESGVMQLVCFVWL